LFVHFLARNRPHNRLFIDPAARRRYTPRLCFNNRTNEAGAKKDAGAQIAPKEVE